MYFLERKKRPEKNCSAVVKGGNFRLRYPERERARGETKKGDSSSWKEEALDSKGGGLNYTPGGNTRVRIIPFLALLLLSLLANRGPLPALRRKCAKGVIYALMRLDMCN